MLQVFVKLSVKSLVTDSRRVGLGPFVITMQEKFGRLFDYNYVSSLNGLHRRAYRQGVHPFTVQTHYHQIIQYE